MESWKSLYRDAIPDAYDVCYRCGCWHYTHRKNQELLTRNKRHAFIAIPLAKIQA